MSGLRLPGAPDPKRTLVRLTRSAARIGFRRVAVGVSATMETGGAKMAVSTRSVSVRRWPLVALSVVLMALGAWVFFVPLVGPRFGFGFDTTTAWRFSALHWQLSLAPGVAIFIGAALMLASPRLIRRLGEL